MSLAAIMAAVQLAKGAYSAGKGLGLWGQPPKHKVSEQEAAYVNELKRRSKEGALGISGISRATRIASKPIMQQAAMQKQSIRGQITNQGLENSAVMTQATQKTDTQASRSLAQIAEKIAMANEMSKTTAQDQLGQYGMMKTNRNYSDAQAAYQARQQGISGVFGAGSDYVTGSNTLKNDAAKRLTELLAKLGIGG